MKFDWTAETKPASGLSRGAAADCSHGLRPWKGVVRDEAPEGRKGPRRICRAFGALARVRLETTAYGRGYTMSPLRGSNRSRCVCQVGQHCLKGGAMTRVKISSSGVR